MPKRCRSAGRAGNQRERFGSQSISLPTAGFHAGGYPSNSGNLRVGPPRRPCAPGAGIGRGDAPGAGSDARGPAWLLRQPRGRSAQPREPDSNGYPPPCKAAVIRSAEQRLPRAKPSTERRQCSSSRNGAVREPNRTAVPPHQKRPRFPLRGAAAVVDRAIELQRRPVSLRAPQAKPASAGRPRAIRPRVGGLGEGLLAHCGLLGAHPRPAQRLLARVGPRRIHRSLSPSSGCRASRPVRTRMPGGVGGAGVSPAPTPLCESRSG